MKEHEAIDLSVDLCYVSYNNFIPLGVERVGRPLSPANPLGALGPGRLFRDDRLWYADAQLARSYAVA